MTLLDSAIANLEKLMACYSRDCDQVNFRRTQIELQAYQDVRDGVPRWQREMALHHAEWRSLYAAHRVDADLLAGKRDERESNP